MTMHSRRYGLSLLALALASAACSAAAHADWLEDAYIAPMASYAIADDKRHTDNGIGGTAGLGYRLSDRVEIELRGMYLDYKGKGSAPCGLLGSSSCAYSDKHLAGGGFGTNLFLGPWYGGPYLHADVMATKTAYYHAGLGWDFSLNDSGWAVRAEALLQTDTNWHYHEPLFNLGLRIPLGPRSKLVVPEPIAEPARVVEPLPAPPPPPPPPPPCTMGDASVDLSGCKTGDTVVLRGVNFEFDKSVLTLNAKGLLDQVVDALKKRSDIKVEIDGHTDGKGSDRYNQKLSEQRAKSVRDYLQQQGIAASRLSSRGFGKSQPIADNTSDEGRALNRRVELKVVDASAGPVTVEQEGVKATTYAAPAASVPQAPVAPVEPTPVSAPPAAPVPAPAPVAAAPTATTVTIADMAFAPGTLTVAVGATVTFVNNDGSNHIVHFADGQQSSRLAMGKSWTRTFSAPGEYAYTCTIHPMMTGRIIVQ